MPSIMQPKKSLGQNFLRDKAVLDKIIQSANLSKNELVIEVGTGEGVLTKELANLAGKIISVEKDEELAKKTAINLQFSNNFQTESKEIKLDFKNNVAIISGDILEINLPKLLEQNDFTNYKVIANIPYYITSPIIRLFLETTYPPMELILMIQKEVAERICAKAGKLSILALSVQYYAIPELLFNVPRTAFFPVPEVDSAVIRITPNIKREEKEHTKKFFKIIKAGFSAKRKTLINNLSNSLQLEKADIEKKLGQIEISSSARAQELKLEEWKKLAKLLS